MQKERIIVSGEEYRDLVLKYIFESKKEILVSTYIFKDDPFGNAVLSALKKKAEEGVAVKVCVDGLGSSDWYEKQSATLISNNFEIRAYHPIPGLTRQFFLWVKLFRRLNIRNHQKLFIFDNRFVILGSRNIQEEALVWRETSIVIDEGDATELKNIFFKLWEYTHKKNLKFSWRSFFVGRTINQRYYFTSHFNRFRRKLLNRRLKNAQNRILITSAYFLPPPKILKIIRQKAKNGVDVQVMLPSVTDVKISRWIAQSLYYVMIRAGIKIYEYKPEILHSKVLIIDDWYLMGSSNFNHRSIIRDIELDYSVQTKETQDQLLNVFVEDRAKSLIVDKAPSINILKRGLFFLVSRLLYSWF